VRTFAPFWHTAKTKRSADRRNSLKNLLTVRLCSGLAHTGATNHTHSETVSYLK
jgi:hypothetical protein